MIFFVGFVRVSYFFLRWGKEAVGLIPVNNNNVKKIITSSIQPVNGKVPPQGAASRSAWEVLHPATYAASVSMAAHPRGLAAVGLAHRKECIILHKSQSRDAKISKINENQK